LIEAFICKATIKQSLRLDKMRKITRGTPFPLGATRDDGWWNFAVYSTQKILSLVIEDYDRSQPKERFLLDDQEHRTGDIWHVAIQAQEPQLLWGWEVLSHPKAVRKARLAVDPYAKLLKTGNVWGRNFWHQLTKKELLIGVASYQETYSSHTPLRPDPLIIYEAHMRGFTRDPSSNVQAPGTYLGFIEKLSHLKKMGISAIELLPIYEFDESEWKKHDPSTGLRLYNYWGYSPLNFFSPMQRYSSSPDPLISSQEMKQFVQACHDLEIAVILDVVYNHTGEGNSQGPAYSFKILGEETYYIKNEDTTFANHSGCGNTLNTNHPIVQKLIIDSLHHWVLTYHIDGFRFDLASVLTRDQTGRPIHPSPIIDAIVEDPILRKVMIIAEPWDAAGLYQTGQLFSWNQKSRPLLMEWNDRFRDDVRLFIKGTKGMSGRFAQRLCGSEDLYSPKGSPLNSINYITAHDGFSLYDLVSYQAKHNEANAEGNRDGMQENFSWNCGQEGVTKKKSVLSLRSRQVKNFLTALFLSQGNPMLVMGDECYFSKQGNNNTWCHDSSRNWFPWSSIEEDSSLVRFISVLTHIRKEFSSLHHHRFLTPKDIEWHGTELHRARWDESNQLIVFSLKEKQSHRTLFVIFNTSSEAKTVKLPHTKRSRHLLINTAQKPSNDCFFIHEAPKICRPSLQIHSYSCVVLITTSS